jgi:hypothetical protein
VVDVVASKNDVTLTGQGRKQAVCFRAGGIDVFFLYMVYSESYISVLFE